MTARDERTYDDELLKPTRSDSQRISTGVLLSFTQASLANNSPGYYNFRITNRRTTPFATIDGPFFLGESRPLAVGPVADREECLH